MKNYQPLKILFLLFLVVIFFTAKNIAFAQQKEFKIGVLQHLTGEFAPYGQAMLDGSKLAADEINSKEKDKFKLKIVSYDHQTNAQKAFMYAKKLVDVDKVDAILISDYHPAKAIAPYLEKNKIPLIVLWDSNPNLEDIGYYTFGIGPWTPAGGELVAKTAKEKFNAKRAVTLAYQDDWALASRDYFKKRFIADGGEVLSEDVVQGDEADFRTILTRMKEKNPDIIYYLLSNNNVTFIKQLRELRLNIPVFTSDILAEAMIGEAKSEFEGVYQTQGVDPDFPATKAMKEKFKTKFNKDPEMPTFSAWGYDAVGMITETIRNGATNAEQIAKGLYSIKDYDGASGLATINEKGSAPKFVGLLQVKGGKLEK